MNKSAGEFIKKEHHKSRMIISSLLILSNFLLSDVNFAYGLCSEKIVKNVPMIQQLPELPTGCEAASAAMLLRWAGIKVSKEEIANALPKGSIPQIRNGKLYGSNPESVFVGNPFLRSGYGVYRKPIVNIINKYLPGQAQDLTGSSFNEILSIIDSGRPVIVWCTINNAAPRVSKIWYDDNGNKVIWKIPEHAVLLIGYTESYVIVNDPWAGKTKYYRFPLLKTTGNIWANKP